MEYAEELPLYMTSNEASGETEADVSDDRLAYAAATTGGLRGSPDSADQVPCFAQPDVPAAQCGPPTAEKPALATPTDVPSPNAADGVTYGYARVSSRDQNLSRQIDALMEFGVEAKRIVSDKASGKNFVRPGYTRLLRRLKPGDTLVVGSIDRFGRNYDEILQEWRKITSSKKANIVVLDMPILDTRISQNGLTGQLISDIVLQLLSYVAQTERDFIRKRQAQGIKAAHLRGVKFGRPRKQRPDNYSDVCRDLDLGVVTFKMAAKLLGVCPATFRKWRQEDATDVDAMCDNGAGVDKTCEDNACNGVGCEDSARVGLPDIDDQ